MKIDRQPQADTGMQPFIDVMKEANSRTDFYESIISQDIEISGFPTKPLSAVWTVGFGDGNLRALGLKIDKKNETKDNLVEISVNDRWDGTQEEINEKQHYFNIFHRFVHTDKMNEEEKKTKGVGSFALKLVEDRLRLMVKNSSRTGPVEIGMLTNQPSVIRFAEVNGYEINNEKQKKYYESLKKEMEENIVSTDFTEEGMLPHFRLINMQIDTPVGPEYVTEGVVLNLEMLREYCDNKEPNYEKYIHLLEKNNQNDIGSEKLVAPVTNPKYAFLEIDIEDSTNRKENMRSDKPHPFFMDFYFNKNL